MGASGPLIEEFFLGEPDLEGYFVSVPISAMAIQPDLPLATKRARYIEAHGYDLKPPVSGERLCYVAGSFSDVDEISVAATKRGLTRCVTEGEVREIKEAYEECELDDAWWVAWRCEQHIHVVIAVLRYLDERGDLPPKHHWGA